MEHESSYNNISGNNITNCYYGIELNYSSNNTRISGNILANHVLGIVTDGGHSSYNDIFGNSITNNEVGLELSGLGNRIYHNDFVANYHYQAFVDWGYVNLWDDGYPSGGNYWSDYQTRYPGAAEIDSSGIWNAPYYIDASNTDNYPLVNPWTVPPPPADDIYWLAKAIVNEAGGADISEQERIAVGWTVLNRLYSGRFGESIQEVVVKGYAQYWTVPYKEPTDSEIKLAKDLLAQRKQDPTDGATHFFSPRSQQCRGQPAGKSK